jgi:hypothetical protein
MNALIISATLHTLHANWKVLYRPSGARTPPQASRTCW